MEKGKDDPASAKNAAQHEHCHSDGHGHHHCGCHDHEEGSHGHHHCGCHDHEEGSQKGKIWLIAITAILLAGAAAAEKTLSLDTWQLLLIYLVPYLLIGHDTLKEAAEGVSHGDMFNEDFLMSIATIGALCIGFLPGADNEFAEAVFVMLFFQIGELFEGYAENRSRESISHLMDIRPDVAHVERGDATEAVAPSEVTPGETIIIKPGEKVPLDGLVIDGASELNTMALTGESAPRALAAGDSILSGCINISGVLRVRTTRSFGESTVSQIIRLVESADEHKSRSESFITRFARVYTPIVVFMALALALIPPLVLAGNFTSLFPVWLNRALIFLVVSCPCALVISVPLTFFGGIGGASRHGILIKGSDCMDTLANLGTVVFDKTGTLTHGEFEVKAVHPNQISERDLLHLAAHVESLTTHPVGAALRNAFPDAACDGCNVTEVEEIAGQGLRARVDGKTVWAGNARLMDSIGVEWSGCDVAGTIIHVAVDGSYAGHIVVGDKIKSDSRRAISRLRAMGVNKTVMLTGDSKAVGADVASKLDIDEFHAELLPADKVAHVERLLREKPKGQSLAFVGDGINDAPVLKRADIGIAMGGMGSDAAIEASDVVLMNDQPSKIATAVAVARRTIRIASQNVWFAIGVKVAILLLAAAGLGAMWMAVFADVGVTVLAVLNAMRALCFKEKP